MLKFFDRFKKKKHLSAEEKIATAKKLLSEFLEISSEQRLEQYEHYIVPALAKLHSVVHKYGKFEYERIELLNADFMLSDIGLIMYFGKDFSQEYIEPQAAKRLHYPKGDYEIINQAIGLCRDTSTNRLFYNARIAIDNSITSEATRWNNNISEIISLF